MPANDPLGPASEPAETRRRSRPSGARKERPDMRPDDRTYSYDPDYRGRPIDDNPTARTAQRLLRAFGSYLAGRPAESWMFFAAGFVLAVMLT